MGPTLCGAGTHSGTRELKRHIKSQYSALSLRSLSKNQSRNYVPPVPGTVWFLMGLEGLRRSLWVSSAMVALSSSHRRPGAEGSEQHHPAHSVFLMHFFPVGSLSEVFGLSQQDFPTLISRFSPLALQIESTPALPSRVHWLTQRLAPVRAHRHAGVSLVAPGAACPPTTLSN